MGRLKRELFFKEDGTFKIIQFTDIHFSEDNELDHRSTNLMSQIILDEKPDFIITTGDTVYGPYNLQHIEKALRPITQSGVPWSYTFGNHDTEEGVDYTSLFQVITSLPNCVAYNADASISGMGNHYVEVKNQRGETKWVLFGIDTGAYNRIPSIGGYDYIKEDQIQWFKKVIGDFDREQNSFSSLVFMHIALPEYQEVWDMETCYGEKREGICCPHINSGFFTAMQEAGHTKGVFVGHDHINDYMGTLYGITLAYGRATGYNTYGQEDYQRGARIIELDVNNTESFQTYIRLEDKTVIKKQVEHKPERKRE
jgi:3',5'-cyclic AMP phosphodiesterase CpdA